MSPSGQGHACTPTALVVGCDGQIGGALFHRLASGGEKVMGTTRRHERVSADRMFLDIAQPASIRQLQGHIVKAYLCAGCTSIAACEEDPIGTRRVNVTGTLDVARCLVEQGASVVFPSTSLVVNGSLAASKHDAAVFPTTQYGRQKALAERELLKLGRVGIVRLSKVVSPSFQLFQSWKKALLAGQACHPYSDAAFAPIPLDFAIEVLCRCAELRYEGIVQASAAAQLTYAEAAGRLALRLGVDPSLVQAVRRSEGPCRRYETLDTSILETDFGLTPPDALETLDKTFDAMLQSDLATSLSVLGRS
jgi:dTDP-4-dehydrorhamnose reductase